MSTEGSDLYSAEPYLGPGGGRHGVPRRAHPVRDTPALWGPGVAVARSPADRRAELIKELAQRTAREPGALGEDEHPRTPALSDTVGSAAAEPGEPGQGRLPRTGRPPRARPASKGRARRRGRCERGRQSCSSGARSNFRFPIYPWEAARSPGRGQEQHKAAAPRAPYLACSRHRAWAQMAKV